MEKENRGRAVTLLSPPDTARMLPVTDQLTLQTTSGNFGSCFVDQVLDVSSLVQMMTIPSFVGRQHKMFTDMGELPVSNSQLKLLAVQCLAPKPHLESSHCGDMMDHLLAFRQASIHFVAR